MRFGFFILWFCLVCACVPVSEKRATSGGEPLKYAKGFTIEHGNGYTVVEVINPWDTATLLQRYVLVNKHDKLPDSLPKGTLVRVPLERVDVFNTVHCGLLERFGVGDKIVGVCSLEYINLPFVHRKIQSGEIIDLGATAKPDFEKIVTSAPDALIVSPFQNQVYGNVLKLGVPLIECVAYMEQLPLGQAEWMKFHALFFGVEQQADSLFDAMERNYISIRDRVAQQKNRPTLLPEQRFGQTWWVPAGESYAANLYKDAGADYIWSQSEGTGSLALSFENVLDKAQKADIWLIRYNDNEKSLTYDALKANYDAYKVFDAFQNRAIFGCNTAQSAYYEKSMFSTDTILMDLAKIFHPHLFEDYAFTYYKPLD